MRIVDSDVRAAVVSGSPARQGESQATSPPTTRSNENAEVSPLESILDALFDFAEWNFPDWLAVVGFPAAAWGLYLAIKSGKDTRQASEDARDGAQAASAAASAAREAAEEARAATGRTAQRISDQNLLMLLSQTRRLADELDRARRTDDLERLASEWVVSVGELQGVLSVQDPEHKLIALLDPSIEAAGNTKNALIGRNADVRAAAKPLLDELTTARREISRILGSMRYAPEQPNG
jgi:hypothetical protein